MRFLPLGVATSAISLFLSLLIAEFGLAWLHPQNTAREIESRSPPIYESDPVLPYRFIPGSSGRLIEPGEFDVLVEIGADGLRFDGAVQSLPASVAPRRILAIGDSFTFGFGVEGDQAWPRQLQDALEGKARVINAGFAGGYSPDTYYLWLSDRGLQMQPDLVVLGLFLGNDITPGAGANRWHDLDAGGLPTRITSREGIARGGRWLGRVKQLRYRIPLLRNSQLAQLAADAITVIKDRNKTWIPEELYREPWNAEVRADWDRAALCIAGMAALLRARDIPLLVVLIPAREQAIPDRVPLSALGRKNLLRPQHETIALLDRLGVPWVNLLPAVLAPTDWFPRDMHWTANGHARAAAALRDPVLKALTAGHAIP